MLAGPSCAASGLSNKWNGTECFYTVRCWDFRDIYTAASKLLLYVWILEWCWSRLLHLLKPIKPEQASTVSVLILIFAESVDCKIPISGIFDDFCISIDANCIFDHLCIGTGDRLGSWRLAMSAWGFLPCSWWCPTALGELPQGGWSLRNGRNGSRNHRKPTVADHQARFGEKEQIEAATASAKSARILVVFQCASYIFIWVVGRLKHFETMWADYPKAAEKLKCGLGGLGEPELRIQPAPLRSATRVCSSHRQSCCKKLAEIEDVSCYKSCARSFGLPQRGLATCGSLSFEAWWYDHK